MEFIYSVSEVAFLLFVSKLTDPGSTTISVLGSANFCQSLKGVPVFENVYTRMIEYRPTNATRPGTAPDDSVACNLKQVVRVFGVYA